MHNHVRSCATVCNRRIGSYRIVSIRVCSYLAAPLICSWSCAAACASTASTA